MIKFEAIENKNGEVDHFEIECKGNMPTLINDAIFMMAHTLLQLPKDVRGEAMKFAFSHVVDLISSGAFETLPKTVIDLKTIRQGQEQNSEGKG